MEFTQVWDRIRTMSTTELRSVVDAAESVVRGSADRTAEQVARDVIHVVRQLRPELLHV